MPFLKSVYATATGSRADAVTKAEPRNALVLVSATTLSKLADGLIDPKLVLAWLLGLLGAPAAAVGALVPVREAGALLPQLPLARLLERRPGRKRAWALGALLQGVAALCIAVAALTLDGAVAGWTIVGALAALSLARAISSVSYKDALARSLPKTRRGAVTGLATSISAAAVLGFGGLLAAGGLPPGAPTLAGVVALAGALLICAGALFLALDERTTAGATAEAADLADLVAPLQADAQLRRFVAARACLATTALAPPFLVLLSSTQGRATLTDLGPLVIASGLASILSGYVWGRVSDRSSRLTLAIAGSFGATVFAAAGGLGLATGDLGGAWGTAAVIFAAQLAYEGIRAGRKLHLTDMAPDDLRARYTALSNMLIGLALIAGSAFGALADTIGVDLVLLIFAGLTLLGAALALSLEEVQATRRTN